MKPLVIFNYPITGASPLKVSLVLLITLVERGLILVPPILVGRIIDFVVAGKIARVSFVLLILVSLGLLQALTWPIKQRYISGVIQSIVLEQSKTITSEIFHKEFEVFAPSRVGHITKVVGSGDCRV